MTKPILLIYEAAQIPLVESRARSGECIVVAMDYDVELDLKKLGIPFESLTALARSPDGDRDILEWTRSLALGWYTAPETAFYSHDGIRLGEQYEVLVLYYLQTLVYYISMIGQVIARYPGSALIVPESLVQVSKTSDPTAAFKVRLPLDVAELLAKRQGVALTIVAAPLRAKAHSTLVMLGRSIKNFFVRVGIGLLNQCVTHATSGRSVRIFATDPWSRIEPIISGMDDAELVMSRRQELVAMGLSAVWRSRARFNHRLDFVDTEVTALSKARAREIAGAWHSINEAPEISHNFVFESVSFWSIARKLFDALVLDHAEDAIRTIENTKRLFAYYDINCVLLFASTKGYNNVIARVAQAQNIPSIEHQHALVNNEKTLVHCRLRSRYLASYGPLINSIYESWGVEPWRLVSCGSPRFDGYNKPIPGPVLDKARVRMQADNQHVQALFCMQQIYHSLEYGNFTSYEVRQALEDVSEATQNVADLHMLLRPRPDKSRERFYNREETKSIFKSDASWVGHEPMQECLALSNFVITGTSTVVIEALLMHKPVVLYIPKALDHDFEAFWQAGAVRMARTKEELEAHVRHLAQNEEHRAHQIYKGDEFIKKSFVFDGGSAERVANLLRRVTKEVAAPTISV